MGNGIAIAGPGGSYGGNGGEAYVGGDGIACGEKQANTTAEVAQVQK